MRERATPGESERSEMRNARRAVQGSRWCGRRPPFVAASTSEVGRRPVFAGDARHGAARTVRMVRAARSVVCGAIGFRPQRPKSGPLAVRGEVRLRALGGERALRRRYAGDASRRRGSQTYATRSRRSVMRDVLTRGAFGSRASTYLRGRNLVLLGRACKTPAGVQTHRTNKRRPPRPLARPLPPPYTYFS